MDFDLMDSTPVAVIEKTQTEAEVAQQTACSYLRKLGYEVVEPQKGSNEPLHLKKGSAAYTMSFNFVGPQSATHLRIPIGSQRNVNPHLFSMKSDFIAFYQKNFEGGTLIQFRLSELRDTIKPLIEKMKEDLNQNGKFYAFAAVSAIDSKRIHAVEREDGEYDFYVYLSIEAVCKKIKHSKQKINN